MSLERRGKRCLPVRARVEDFDYDLRRAAAPGIAAMPAIEIEAGETRFRQDRTDDPRASGESGDANDREIRTKC